MGVALMADQLISVILPVFNGGIYLADAVHSILNQTHQNIELIIINDGSTDQTGALLALWQKCDARIRVCSRPNRGLVASLNEGIDLAHGQWIARMDADDVSFPRRLECQLQLLTANPAIDVLATRAVTIDENNRITGLFPWSQSHEAICHRPWLGFHFPHPTWMGKAEWFRKYHYSSRGTALCEDQELLLRSYRHSTFATHRAILFAYRLRSATDWERLAKTRCAVLRFQHDFFVQSRMYPYVVFSRAAFLAKTLRDFACKLTGATCHPFMDEVNKDTIAEWAELLRKLHFYK
jgi:glycosyltransferase involved in cell wall biosynthesis